MAQSAQKTPYLCSKGHQSERPGKCSVDGEELQAANYVCPYCGSGSMTAGKRGMCPSCEAELQAIKRPDVPPRKSIHMY